MINIVFPWTKKNEDENLDPRSSSKKLLDALKSYNITMENFSNFVGENHRLFFGPMAHEKKEEKPKMRG